MLRYRFVDPLTIAIPHKVNIISPAILHLNAESYPAGLIAVRDARQIV
jgi:hypothetical protein